MSVTTTGLVKRYRDTVALASVDLDVPNGSVYGLVGPNGAGKTTLLGILTRLRHATSGSIDVSATRVGVLPDTPRFDGWLTALEVVDLARVLADADIAPERVDEVLGEAGLSDALERGVGGFSRGMLQRLGLAAAVVGDPDLLLLDEPAAALDPAGRREVLDLVARLRGRATVVFSSHILDDVQEVCDQVGILRRGELVYQGPLDGLLAGRAATARYVVTVREGADQVADALTAAPWATSVSVDGEQVTVDARTQDDAELHLVGTLAGASARVVAVTPVERSLEDVFLEVTR